MKFQRFRHLYKVSNEKHVYDAMNVTDLMMYITREVKKIGMQYQLAITIGILQELTYTTIIFPRNNS